MRKNSGRKDRRPEREPRAPAERGDRKDSRAPEARAAGVGRLLGSVVSRRHERGVPYPGDFPNPLDGKYRGCY